MLRGFSISIRAPDTKKPRGDAGFLRMVNQQGSAADAHPTRRVAITVPDLFPLEPAPQSARRGR